MTVWRYIVVLKVSAGFETLSLLTLFELYMGEEKSLTAISNNMVLPVMQTRVLSRYLLADLYNCYWNTFISIFFVSSFAILTSLSPLIVSCIFLTKT